MIKLSRLGFLLLLAGLGLAVQAGGGAAPERYRIQPDFRRYPQATPQKALESVVRAINVRDFSYLMAQLADPAYVDAKVEDYKKSLKGPENARTLVAFDKLAQEVARHFQDDPSLARELRRFAKEGEWEVGPNGASARLKDVASRRVYFKKLQDRWYLENRMEARPK